jgi:hypothetical protein
MDVERVSKQPDSVAPPLKVFVAWDFSDKAQGQLLQGCRDKNIALVDNANANVAWEAGLAMG